MTTKERRRYGKTRTSISKASSYEEIGEFWDTHDLTDYWSKTRREKFDVKIESEVMYYPVERKLSEKIQSLAKKRGGFIGYSCEFALATNSSGTIGAVVL